MSITWNPWHGCHKVSEGCRNCYVYRRDSSCGIDSSQVRRNADFNLPVRRDRHGRFKVAAGETLYTCFTSDFFLAEADPWREQVWEMMRMRPDLNFFIITKRPERIAGSLPGDWGGGWTNVSIACTVENQRQADLRLPVYMSLPMRHFMIVCAPLLGPLDLRRYLSPAVEEVSVGGESGPEARLCDYEWVLDIRNQCLEAGIPFVYHQTGALLRKNGHIYRIARRYQHSQARRAGINHTGSIG